MAYMRLGKETPENKMFQEYWALLQNFWKPEEDESYWKNLHDACVDFANKHGEFAKDLVLSFIKECERKLKQDRRSEIGV